MLKRFAILLLCLVYTASVFGIVVNVRYCGSEPTQTTVVVAKNCPMCHSVKVMKCCKTSHVQVKVKDVHVGSSNGVDLAKTIGYSLLSFNLAGYAPVWKQAAAERIVYYGPHAPPPDSDLILIKNQVFRI